MNFKAISKMDINHKYMSELHWRYYLSHCVTVPFVSLCLDFLLQKTAFCLLEGFLMFNLSLVSLLYFLRTYIPCVNKAH